LVAECDPGPNLAGAENRDEQSWFGLKHSFARLYGAARKPSRLRIVLAILSCSRFWKKAARFRKFLSGGDQRENTGFSR